jgi:Ca2+/Na+ antiporter
MDTIAIAEVNNAPPHTITSDWEHTYRPLPDLFFGLAVLWMLLVFVWTLNTWAKRRWQVHHRHLSLLLLVFFAVFFYSF